jgi:hypothetical protein
MIVLVLFAIDTTYNSALIHNSTSTIVRPPSEYYWCSPFSEVIQEDYTSIIFSPIVPVLLVSMIVLVLFAIDTTYNSALIYNSTSTIERPSE